MAETRRSLSVLPLVKRAGGRQDAVMTTSPRTQVLFFDGVDDLDPIGPLEILTAAGLPVTAVRPADHPSKVHTAHGLTLEIDPVLDETAELVIVPGGGWLDAGPGVRTHTTGALPAQLAAIHSRGTVIASVCTGAMLVAAAGLLDGRPAVTNRGAFDDLAAAGAIVEREARVVDIGDVVTSGGPAAGLDLGVHLVGRFLGAEAGQAAAARLEHVPVGPVLTPVS
jgi:transcriptional regulator GlxA family with amidase domain